MAYRESNWGGTDPSPTPFTAGLIARAYRNKILMGGGGGGGYVPLPELRPLVMLHFIYNLEQIKLYHLAAERYYVARM